jgi:hypothetical protein
MSDMKLIMEGWRQYNSIDEQYEETLAYVLENYDGLLTEGIKDDILSSMSSLVKRFGKKAVTVALVASISTGALAPGIAAAAGAATGVDLPVAAQQMDAEEAKKIIDMSEVGKELKDIFGKDGKLSKLFKKKAVDDSSEETPEAALSPEGFSQNSETGDYEFRVGADRGYQDQFAKNDARMGLVKELVKQGVLEANSDGSVSVQGLSVGYEGDRDSGQFVGKWSPERAEKAQEMQRQMQQLGR